MVPPPSCFQKNTLILCRNNGEDQYIPIQNIRPGMLVKTFKNGYKPVDMIGVRTFQNDPDAAIIGNKLYVCSQANYPELTQDLIMTGYHSVLVNTFKDNQREQTKNALGKIYVTDNMYRLPLCVDDRANVYSVKGETLIYHLALEHADNYMNYGIYANGLLVETCSKRFIKELSGMDLIATDGRVIRQNECDIEVMIPNMSETIPMVM
jgi:hypothetical protein